MNTCEVVRLPAGHRHALPAARRADRDVLDREIRSACHSPLVEAVLAAADTLLLVLNAQRQIVAFNLRARQPATTFGQRPGEALGCVNAQGPGGCGTAPACETCGALGAILASQQRAGPVEAECLIRSELYGTDSEFNVRACPVAIGEHQLTVLSLRDISSEKRRQALEQIFFHDVLNTITGLRGWTELLQVSGGRHPSAPERIQVLSRHIEREVRDHRALVLAENGSLVPHLERVRGSEILRDIDAVFATHSVARDRRIEAHLAADVELETDRCLLARVLVNMVRNALEATEPGGAIRIEVGAPVAPGSDDVRFTVWNDGVMPAEVQARVFQRSFSTKSQRGRGLGTYSMKLLGERYLGGTVSFVSSAERGTVFTLQLAGGRRTSLPPAAC
ncbi:MAG TPA: HAMP domain-containing sensor histidine kinase [Anaeromyxobacteraceae bacterium]